MDLTKQISLRKLRRLVKSNTLTGRDWEYISHYQNLSESFIREFQNEIDWGYISYYQKLSESFIRKFQNRVDWGSISYHQNLSEPLIREFQNYVNWRGISSYQKLSESFIREFQSYISWDDISSYQKLSKSFVAEFKDRLPKDYDPVIVNIFHCGPEGRVVRIYKSNPNIIHLGCFIGTKTEAIAAVKEKYPGRCSNYIKQIKNCFAEAKLAQLRGML